MADASDTDISDKVKSKKDSSNVGPSAAEIATVPEVWLICAPGDKTPKATWDAVNKATSKAKKPLSVNFKFSIPELKVGTLDVLVGLLDDFSKLDPVAESLVHKVIHGLHETLEESKDKTKEHLGVHGTSIPHYLSKFQWDLAKYSIKQSIRNIGEIIAKQVSDLDAELKAKLAAYNNTKTALQNYERKQTGSLLTRNLAEIVSKHDFVTDSEVLVTVLVVIGKAAYTEFINKYETLDAMVVPRSAKLIKEDNESGLFAVTLFQTAVDKFKMRCREHKFIVRDFVYNEKDMAEAKEEHARLVDEKKKQYPVMVRWLKLQFSEAFSAWIHVKALRVYIESILRFGLPVNFQPILVVPYKKSERKLRTALHRLFSYLDTTCDPFGTDLSTIPGLTASSEYYPYVYYKISMELHV